MEDTHNDLLPIARPNWEALRLFLLLATQWRLEANRPIGIDYRAIEPTAKLAAIKISEALFEKLRFMEQIAIKIYSEITSR